MIENKDRDNNYSRTDSELAHKFSCKNVFELLDSGAPKPWRRQLIWKENSILNKTWELINLGLLGLFSDDVTIKILSDLDVKEMIRFAIKTSFTRKSWQLKPYMGGRHIA